MKTLFLVLSFVVAVCSAFAASTPVPPAELEATRKALAAAVKAHDLKAIVALSRFPLAFSGYEAPEEISAADFLADENAFASLFYDGGEQIVTCLATAKLDHQAETPDFPGSPWYIDCDGNEYYFGLVDSAWRFTSYMNVNE
ncbi:MAG: hypothetical protein AB7F09_17950 [Parvibaculaceae bacterium]